MLLTDFFIFFFLLLQLLNYNLFKIIVTIILLVLNGWMKGDNGIKRIKDIKKTGSWRTQNIKEQTQ